MRRSKGLLALLLLWLARAAAAQEISVELLAESDEVYVGEQFAVQIRVEGSSSPKEPDLRNVRDFDVRFLGGQTNNAEYVSITNGKVTRSSSLGYVFSYQFSARATGTFAIPAIAVDVEGHRFATAPKRISVIRPSEADDFRLVVEPSAAQAYVGEGMELAVTWYIAAPVRSVYFFVPFLKNASFRVRTPETNTTPGGKYAKVTVNDEESIVELGETVLDGKPYTTVRFKRIVTPLTAGSYAMPESTVQFEARVERSRQRSLVDSFLDATMGGDYRPFVIGSRKGTIRVAALPRQGMPSRFAGHVGRYVLRASATPLEATVGDPITLTLTMAGPLNVQDAPPPVLPGQRVEREFILQDGEPQSAPSNPDSRVPERSYAYTIRASRAGVTEIPAVELPYFDPQTSRYETARSAPVPLRIVEARIVTSRDAEGEPAATTEGASAPQDSAAQGGIAHNYEDAAVLTPQYRGLAALSSRAAVALLLLLSVAAVAVSAALTTGKRWVAGRIRGGRSALRACARALRAVESGEPPAGPASALTAILSALTAYFARRLSLPPGAGTFGDIEQALRRTQAPEEPLGELRDVFRICEAGRYAGYPLSAETAREVARRGMTACTAVEEHLAARERMLRSREPPPRALTGIVVACAISAAFAGTLEALSSEEARDLFARAIEAFRAGNEAAPKDPKRAGEMYLSSARLLERITADGAMESAGLYYDLGNAYYRLGDLGRAILAYRRAQLFEPADQNLQHNLTQARLEREDLVEAPVAPPVARIFLFWHRDFSPGTRATIFALFFAAGCGLVCAWLFARRPALLRAAAAFALPALLLFGSLAADEVRLARSPEGVIVTREVIARRGDGEIYQPSFQRPLHAGTEFTLREERRDWYLIQIADGRSCWIPAGSAELLLPPPPGSPR